MIPTKFRNQVPHCLRLHQSPPNDPAEHAIIRRALVSGVFTQDAEDLLRKHYNAYIAECELHEAAQRLAATPRSHRRSRAKAAL